MKHADDNSMFSGMNLPDPGSLGHRESLKIPLLSYRRSSRAGLWLLVLPLVFAVARFLKYELGLSSSILNVTHALYKSVSGSPVLTYLIPVIFLGLPLLAMIVNLLAICHFDSVKEKQELVVTIKRRPLNIAVFLLSFAVVVYAFLPDALP